MSGSRRCRSRARARPTGAGRWALAAQSRSPRTRRRSGPFALIDGEAVEQARAAGGHQIFLAASARGMGGVPGSIAAAGAGVVSELGGAGAGAAPGDAGVVGASGGGAAGGLRAGKDVVLIGIIAVALDGVALFAERGG